MMRLSTMWKVHQLDEADGRNPIADGILERWEHDPGSVRLFRASANSVFVFRLAGGRCFLRIADEVERERAAVEAEVALLRWLADAGMNVAAPIPSRSGHCVETVVTAWGTFHAVAFRGLDGAQREVADLDGDGFRAWGAALGRLHAVMRGYDGPARVVRDTWREQLASVARHVQGDDRVVRAEIDRVGDALAALPTDDDRYGLIHGDFELDNLSWRDGAVGILDFDDCARSWFAADVAFALRDLFGDFGDEMDLGNGSFRAFVDGYTAEHPLDEGMVMRLPTFRRLGNLIQYARLVRALDLPEAPEHPAWLRGLRRKLSDRAASYRATFLRHEGYRSG